MKETILWPFFTFYGGKWRAAPRYPKPTRNIIIEPFAGAAGYAVRYFNKQVVLIEKDVTIAALWRYLIEATSDDIKALPLVRFDQSVDDLDICDAAKSLIGFWLNKGCNGPCKIPGAWMRSNIRPKSHWGAEIRDRIASQVEAISHWMIIEGDYSCAPDIEATWFIDPPYIQSGRLYKHSSKNIDYDYLGLWCRDRSGQVIVCENDGATWLPFQSFIEIKTTEGSRGKSKSREAIWTREQIMNIDLMDASRNKL